MSIVDRQIGERLKQVRGNHSQQDFAKTLGVHQNTYANYETGRGSVIKTDVLLCLAEKYNVDLHWLITGIFRSGTQQAPQVVIKVPDGVDVVITRDATTS